VIYTFLERRSSERYQLMTQGRIMVKECSYSFVKLESNKESVQYRESSMLFQGPWGKPCMRRVDYIEDLIESEMI
jgi:hypothetical protein